jgi:hypothetical protein
VQCDAYVPAYEHQNLSECLLPIRGYNGEPILLVGVGPTDRGGQRVAVCPDPAEHSCHLAVA